jgi:toxin secretion/phage lysis holin
MKHTLLAIVGIIGSMISNLLGGWDMALQTLIIFMAVDYITGLVVAGVFKKSTKSESGALESKAGYKGLAKKGMTLLIVLVATRLDLIIGSNFIRDAVIIGYIVNEAVSIIENAGLMGLPVGKTLTNAIDILKRKGEENG